MFKEIYVKVLEIIVTVRNVSIPNLKILSVVV